MKQVTRNVDIRAVQDLLEKPHRACLCFAGQAGPLAQPIAFVWHDGRYLAGIQHGDDRSDDRSDDQGNAESALPDANGVPRSGTEAVLLIDDGTHYFDLRAISARSLIRTCRVARLGTLSRTGRTSINPLYFARHHGHIWLGTSDWTLAARNVRADSRVVLLFQGEARGGGAAGEGRILRVSGHAVVRRDRQTQRVYNIRVAFRYLLRPGEILSSLRHARQRKVRREYHAQNRRKGEPCVIDVVPDRVDVLGSVEALDS